MTETQAATSVRSAIESWLYGKDHGLIMWRKMLNDPLHAVERGRDILLKVALGNLAEWVMEEAGEEADDLALLTATEKITKDLERQLLRGIWFEERSSSLFKRGTAEIRCMAAVEFVRRIRRTVNGEEDNGA
jgi:hypothetical protein